MAPRRAARAAAWLLAGALLALPAGAATAWRITLDGEDVTRAADPRDAGGIPLVDAAALAPRLGLVVRVEGKELSVRAAGNAVWRGEPGGDRLTSPAGILHLERSLRAEGRSLYIPLGAVAELSGFTLIISAQARTAALQRSSGVSSGGWSAFTLAKPVAEGGLAGAAVSGAIAPALPPGRESLRVALGVGQVQGTEWGGELAATGSVRGVQTRMSGLLVSGPAGLELRSGRLALAAPELRLGAEAGDLFSEIWGSAQGVRLLQERGEEGSRALSVYLPDRLAGRGSALLAWRDGLRLGDGGVLEGEAASDGSWLLRGRWSPGRLSLFAHLRDASVRSLGLSGSLDLSPGWSLQAAYDASSDESGTAMLALRAPLPRGGDLMLESTGSRSRSVRLRSDSMTVSFPLPDLLLRARGQRRAGHTELLASASWSGAPGLRVDFQAAGRWPDAGPAESWQQAAVAWKLFRTTSLQAVAAWGSAPFPERLRLRLSQELPRGFTLLAERGDDWDGVRLLVSRTWDVATPAGGGRVQGRVGEPGIPVQLGPYRVLTDEQGRYAFEHVPAGDYDLAIPQDLLPASYSAGAARRKVRVTRRTDERVDLPLQRLAEARGWVYVDRDGDGRRDPGEGVGGVVVVLDGRPTRSTGGGAFTFANLPPGRHELRLDTARLPAGLAATVPSRIEMGLPPGAVLDTLELRLVEQRKAVVFQEPGR